MAKSGKRSRAKQRPRTRHPALTVAALGLLGLGAAVAGFAFWRSPPPESDTEAMIALGRQVYEANCAACHGVNLEGQPNWRQRRADGTLPAPPHDAAGHTWHHPDQQLFAVTKYGVAALAGPGYKSDMPGFGTTLSDAEIRAVLEYIKSTWPEEIRRRQAQATLRARTQGGG
ncbi:MAG: cytochrome c [Alphaproteobacteria bacterium]|nr:MAG: cytochrome c [Alphaproteobacteria bacterium]